jgi:Family of unknown function (DUF5662)
MRHLKYAGYLIRHKWFVYRAGLWTRAPLWRLIIHDWSKFLPSEWVPYANYFYGGAQPKERKIAYFHQPGDELGKRFDKAWLLHIHRQPHHWQHWVLREDEGGTKCLEMPHHFVREMVADWLGAGRTQTGKWGIRDWYDKNKNNIRIHDNTRLLVEYLLAGL